MITAHVCRDAPTERIPKPDAFTEADLLAADLRNAAERLSRLGILRDGPENPAALLRELADAVERAGNQP